MKTRIGVITFHDANNFGAVLQAYALQEFLKKEGCTPSIIDYRPESSIPFKNDYRGIKKALYQIPISSKKRKFWSFLARNCTLTNAVSNKEELAALNKEFDLFITGSDQVFSPKWRQGDLAYFLDFAEEDKCYSYAASFGIGSICDEFAENIRNPLMRFKRLSVREESGREILRNRFGIDSQVNVDPVLLLSKQEWQKAAKKTVKGKYILLYTLENNGDLLEKAKKTAKERGLKLIRIADSLKRKRDGIDYKSFIGPEEFVGLFENAEIVFTNSFHGFMFSFIFEKELYLYLQNDKGAPNSRFIDFSNRYALSSLIVADENQDNRDFNFEESKKLLSEDIRKSAQYISSISKPKIANEKNKCSYCGACQLSCPRGAIRYDANEEGFPYPVIDYSLCINCKKCEKTCEYINKNNDGNHISKAFAVKNSNLEERLESRSGGLFFLIAKKIVETGGIVYGAIVTSEGKVEYARGTTAAEIKAMQKSKYVEAGKNGLLLSAISDLKNGKTVFFSGTPCAIAGLKRCALALNVSTDRLFTMDVLCHGVTSPLIFEEYEKKQIVSHGAIRDFQFRDKGKGWDTHFESFYDRDNSKVFSDEYASIFYSHFFLRPSCYNCLYSSLKREADITGGDCWGINHEDSFYDNNGISLALINNEKGQQLFDMVSPNAEIKEVSLENFMQGSLRKPNPMPTLRDKIWGLYHEKGYEAVAKKVVSKRRKERRWKKFIGFLAKTKNKIFRKR